MSDTNAIEEKKKQESQTASSDYISKLKGFGKSFLTVFFVVLLYFAFSGVALLLCKVAQSNVLPTEPACAPYTTQDPIIQPIQTNIFTSGLFTEEEVSMKLEVPTSKANMTYKILETMRDYKMKSSANFLANYFIGIIESLVQFNFSTINTLMNLVNGLPETLIVIAGPFINGLLFGIGVVVNFCYFIYLYFSQMGWFFKENMNANNADKPPMWVDVDWMSPIDYGIGVALVVLFVILFFVGLPFLALIPFLIVCYCTISSILFKVKLNGARSSSLFTVILGVLLHYKLTIVTILSVTIVSLAFTDLGTAQGIMAILTACCIYYGLIRFDTFSPVVETNLTPDVSYDQATKTCKKQGRQITLDDLSAFGGGGKQFSRRLKKIGEKLQASWSM